MGRLPVANPKPSTLRSRKHRSSAGSGPRTKFQTPDSPLTVSGQPARPEANVTVELPGVALLGSTEHECELYAARAKSELDAAIAKGESMSTRASLSSTYRQALAQLREHRGEGELSDATVARSAPFRRALDRLMRCLTCDACIEAVDREFNGS
jgi:hypothetical protein